ncbi:MAG: efflux transporter outer membrane subunit [Desulfobacteraceae bacterium]|nr:efflux transporter outer membrane subunit [Desulfobacteraceae bacterium]
MRRPLIFALTILLAGCMVGPDYRRPAVDTPQSYRYEEADARGTVNIDWWKQFEDPVLDGLITEALSNNKNVKIAAANVENAAGVLLQTRSPLFPQFNYTGTAARQLLSERNAAPISSVVANPQNAYQVLAGASWEIDLWGRIRRLTEAAQANLLSTEEARRGVILSLVSSVAGNYMQLRGLDKQLEVANKNLAAYAESVDLFEKQFSYGQVSQMNLTQAQSQYDTALASIPQIESQIAQLEHAISILLGRNPGPITRGKPIFQMSLPEIPIGVPSEILERRPDIRQAEQNLIAANAKIGAARALYFPTISLTGTMGTASDNLTDLFTGPARVWNYTGTLTGPIFTAGSIAGQVQQATATQKAALLSYESSIQNGFSDVENALIARRKLEEQLGAQEKLVATLRQYEHLAKLQYEGGYATYLTVLNAEQQLFPAELNYAQTRASLCAAYVKIYQAMGGGWVVMAEKTAEETPQPEE